MHCKKWNALASLLLLCLSTGGCLYGQNHSAAPTSPDWSSYNLPGILSRVYAGRLEDVPDDRNARDYIAFLLDGLNTACTTLKFPAEKAPNDQGFRLKGPADIVANYDMFYEWHANQGAIGDLLSGHDISVNAYFNAVSQDKEPHRFEQAANDGKMLGSKAGCNSPIVARVWNNLWDILIARRNEIPMPPDNRSFYTYARHGFIPQTAYSDQTSLNSLNLLDRCNAKASQITYSGLKHTAIQWCKCITTVVGTVGFDQQTIDTISSFSMNDLYSLGQKRLNDAEFRKLDAREDMCSKLAR